MWKTNNCHNTKIRRIIEWNYHNHIQHLFVRSFDRTERLGTLFYHQVTSCLRSTQNNPCDFWESSKTTKVQGKWRLHWIRKPGFLWTFPKISKTQVKSCVFSLKITFNLKNLKKWKMIENSKEMRLLFEKSFLII